MKNYFQFVASNWALLLFCFCCVFWGNFGQSFFLGWYGDPIRESLNLSSQAYGASYSIATLFSGFTMMWIGAWIDQWTLKRFVLFVAGGLFVAAVLLSFAANFYTLTLAFFGIRLFGQGLMPHIGNTTVARSFDLNRGKAISISACGVPLGEVLLPVFAVFLMAQMGWAHSWWVIAASIPLLFLPLATFLLFKAGWIDKNPESHAGAEHTDELKDLGEPKEKKQTTSAKKILFTDRRYWFAAPTILSAPFMLTAIFIHQGFLMAEKLWTPEVMALGFVVYGVVHWFSSMFFGVLVDRYSGCSLLKIYNIPLVVALLLIANVSGEYSVLMVMAALGATIGASGPVVGSLWAEVYGAKVLGGVRSAAGAVIVLSTAISPYLFGYFIDNNIPLTLMFNIAAVVVLSALFLLQFSFKSRVY